MFYSLLSDMFMLILYGVLRFMTPRDVRNAGSPDGSEISELMENNASWVVNRSKVIPSSAANPALRIKWWKAARPLRNRFVNCLIYFYSPSLQFIHAFEIRTGIAVATQETLMNTLGRENNKNQQTCTSAAACFDRVCFQGLSTIMTSYSYCDKWCHFSKMFCMIFFFKVQTDSVQLDYNFISKLSKFLSFIFYFFPLFIYESFCT